MSDQNKVIEDVLAHISKSKSMSYSILSRPDEEERNLPACDTLAKIGKTKVAVEHTTIDSVPNQRRDNDRFMKLLVPLEEELKGKLPTPGYYCLNVEMNAISVGFNWVEAREKIRQWCIEKAPTLKLGSPRTAPDHFARGRIDGVPFEVTLCRWEGREGKFYLGRFSPSDIEIQRKDVIVEALKSRGTKVAAYKAKGYRSILILESNDITLANPGLIGQAFMDAVGEINSDSLPDEVYLIETDSLEHYIFCLKSGTNLLPE